MEDNIESRVIELCELARIPGGTMALQLGQIESASRHLCHYLDDSVLQDAQILIELLATGSAQEDYARDVASRLSELRINIRGPAARIRGYLGDEE